PPPKKALRARTGPAPKPRPGTRWRPAARASAPGRRTRKRSVRAPPRPSRAKRRRRTEAPPAPPATASGRAPTRRRRAPPDPRCPRPTPSPLTPFQFVQHPPDLGQLFARGALGRERLEDEILGRPVERLPQEVADETALRLVLGERRLVAARALALVPFDQALVRHDLHELEDGRVARPPRLAERLEDLPHGARASPPEHLEAFQFRVRRARQAVFRHCVGTSRLKSPGRLLRSGSYCQRKSS